LRNHALVPASGRDPIRVVSQGGVALSARRWKLVAYALFTGLVLAGQTVFFLAGRLDGGKRLRIQETFFTDQLATAFLQGQTSLAVTPAPLLAQAPDPFDPQLKPLWYWDAALYQGRYYVYWGPVPALFLAVFKAWSGAGEIPDRFPVLCFSLLLTLSASALLAVLADRLPSRPLLAPALGTAVVAFGSPGPFLLGHPQVYELAIVAAQAFLLGGLLFAALGCEARGGRRTLCDLACATCWTLAVASRQTAVFAVVALWLLTCFWWLARAGRLPVARMLVFATPALLGMLLLGAYNQVRFGSPLETGHRYQLGHPVTVGPEHVAANLYSYLLRPPRLAQRFPYVVSRWQGRPPFPAWLPVPSSYFYREPVAGLLYTSPFYLFAAFALVFSIRARLRSSRAASGTRAEAGPREDWSVQAGLILATLPFAVPIFYFASTMRYLGDVTPGLAVLSVLGLLRLVEAQRERRWARRGLLGLATLTAIYTAGMGLLLGSVSYFGFLPNVNPELWSRLERLFPVFGQ
jgi:hypothetical protein